MRGLLRSASLVVGPLGAALLWTVGAATGQSAPDFYAGKQITLIVGASTGGGYDTQARLVARSIQTARPDWLRDNKITLLMQAALNKQPELGNLPSALDFVGDQGGRKVLELYLTQKTLARPIIARRGLHLNVSLC